MNTVNKHKLAITAVLNYCQHWITEESYRLQMSISLTVQIRFATLATVQVRKTLCAIKKNETHKLYGLDNTKFYYE
jgi:hypothetical protein